MSRYYTGYPRHSDYIYQFASNKLYDAPRSSYTKAAAQDDVFSPLASNPFQFDTSHCRTQLAGENSESANDSQKEYFYVSEKQEQEAIKQMRDRMAAKHAMERKKARMDAKNAAMGDSNNASTGKSTRQRLASGAENRPRLQHHRSGRCGGGTIQDRSRPNLAHRNGSASGEFTGRSALRPAEEYHSGDTTVSEYSSDEETEEESEEESEEEESSNRSNRLHA